MSVCVGDMNEMKVGRMRTVPKRNETGEEKRRRGTRYKGKKKMGAVYFIGMSRFYIEHVVLTRRNRTFLFPEGIPSLIRQSALHR